jgi:uncharacterized protein YkwD
VYGQVELTDDRVPVDEVPTTGRHRGRQPMSAPLALGLTVTALLTAFGVAAALLPPSFTGPGAAGESPAAYASQDPAADTNPAAAPSTSASAPTAPAAAAPAPSKPPAAPAPQKPKAKPAPTKAETKPQVSAPKVGKDQESQENEVIRLTNIERGKAGCGALKMNTKLRTAIRLHVQELGTHGNLYISHVSDDGRSFVDRAKAQGYTAPGGENVARGQTDAADVMNSWMNSQGHRENILNCSFKAIGVGEVKGVDGTLVWGQIFGRA